MTTATIPFCLSCGRALIVASNGLTLCPTEDGPAPSLPILVDGEKMDDPFATVGNKTLFERAHDATHRSFVRNTYPEQFKGGAQ